MRILAAIVAAAVVLIAAVPHQVTHTRCAKLVAEDDFDRFEWVTRDGRRTDVEAGTCHPMRFWRAAMVEWPADQVKVAEGDLP